MSTRVQTRVVVLAGLLVALLIAGVVSYYASSHPDGLEYVAGQEGFADTAKEHHVADGPMADYSTKGVDDARLSGGIAGVTGTLVVLLLAGGGFLLLRRRSDEDAPETAPAEPGA